MQKYFLLPELTYETERAALEEYVLSFSEWSTFGLGRFTLNVGPVLRELYVPIALKFKNPKELFRKIEMNMIKPNGIIVAHTDCQPRRCTLNVPILGDFKNSSLDFYTHNTSGEKGPKLAAGLLGQDAVYHPKHYVEEELVEQVNYTVPICFNTQEVHGVTNCTNENRYILTMSFKDELTHQQLYEMYEYGDLLV
jgi:hypothetical protein